MLGFRKNKLIPAFLSFDVEPDGFQLPRSAPPPWPGYGAMFEIAEKLRSRLFERSGVVPKFGWYFRTDPQIAEVYGGANSALVEFPDRIATFRAHGDYFGVHCHPIRWCQDRRQWVHDIGDAWIAKCTRSALDAFAEWQGSPALRFRAGGGYLSNTMVDIIDEGGVKVDLSLEPVKGWWLYSSDVQTAIDSSPIIGKYTDCDTAPRVAYRPAREDFRIRGSESGRRLIMIPHTTAAKPEASFWRKVVQRLHHRPSGDAMMLYPSVEWPSAAFFWDTVARQIQSMHKPYLSLGFRTDAPGSLLVTRVRQILDALPQHGLAERLRFVDPIDVAPRLV